MATQQQFSKSQKRTFADNWMDSIDEILQLMLSDAIWKEVGFQPNQRVQIERKTFHMGEGLVRTVWYLSGKPIMMTSKCFESQKIPLHYTICV